MDLSRFRLATTKQAGQGIFAPRFGASTLFQGGSGSGVPATSKADDKAVEVLLSSRAKKSGSSNSIDPSILPKAPESGIRSLLTEISARTNRIRELSEQRDKQSPGSDRLAQLEKELGGQEEALASIFQSDSYKRITDIVSNVQQILSQGGDRRSLLGALQGDASLLGRDFLARVGNGESSNISLFSGYLSTLEKAVTGGNRDQSFFSLVDSAVSGALRALDGPQLGATPIAAADDQRSDLVAPLPQLQQLEFSSSGELAIGIRGYIGANAVQAAMAHLDYDPKQALVLLADKPEDAEEKRKQEEKENKQDKERQSAALRAGGET